MRKISLPEKIWDSIMAECVCFYVGCPNIQDWVDPACISYSTKTVSKNSLNII